MAHFLNLFISFWIVCVFCDISDMSAGFPLAIWYWLFDCAFHALLSCLDFSSSGSHSQYKWTQRDHVDHLAQKKIHSAF